VDLQQGDSRKPRIQPMKTLEEIAESITTNESYNSAYKKSSPWILNLLQEAYEEMGDHIVLTSTKKGKDYLSYLKAAEIMDKAVLTVAAIYETGLQQLKSKLNDAGISTT